MNAYPVRAPPYHIEEDTCGDPAAKISLSKNGGHQIAITGIAARQGKSL